VLIGKSMGGRIGCHVALHEAVTAAVCLGYPLQSPGPRASLRDQVLLELRTPVLFIQGTRDKLCPLPLLQGVRDRMQTANELLVVDQGDHSLAVTQGALRKQGVTQANIEQQIIERIRSFVATCSVQSSGA
jgi:predicted alpha/beta-hydrolase family hydrolase